MAARSASKQCSEENSVQSAGFANRPLKARKDREKSECGLNSLGGRAHIHPEVSPPSPVQSEDAYMFGYAIKELSEDPHSPTNTINTFANV